MYILNMRLTYEHCEDFIRWCLRELLWVKWFGYFRIQAAEIEFKSKCIGSQLVQLLVLQKQDFSISRFMLQPGRSRTRQRTRSRFHREVRGDGARHYFHHFRVSVAFHNKCHTTSPVHTGLVWDYTILRNMPGGKFRGLCCCLGSVSWSDQVLFKPLKVLFSSMSKFVPTIQNSLQIAPRFEWMVWCVWWTADLSRVSAITLARAAEMKDG